MLLYFILIAPGQAYP